MPIPASTIPSPVASASKVSDFVRSFLPTSNAGSPSGAVSPVIGRPLQTPEAVAFAIEAQKKSCADRTDEEEAAALEIEAFGSDPSKLELDEDDWILTRRYQRNLVHFLYEEDLELFDEVVKYKTENPNAGFDVAIEKFVERPHCGAIVKIVYQNPQSHWDAVLKYDLTLPIPTSKKSKHALEEEGAREKKELEHRRQRIHFERELLRHQLILVRERGLDSEAVEKGTEDAGAHFVKLMCTFEALCAEAQKIKLMVEVSSRELQLREKVHKKLAERSKERSHTLSALQRRVLATTAIASSPSSKKIPEDQPRELPEHKPLKKTKFNEGPDGTIVGALRFSFCLVKDYLDEDLDVFSIQHLHIFKGGNPEESGSSPGKVKLHFFNHTQRNLLVHEIAVRCKITAEGGHGHIGINDLLLNSVYVDFYPVHDGPHEPESTDPTAIAEATNDRRWLYENWATVRFQFAQLLGVQPFRKIRNYFGEKVAFYFSFLGFYTLWLYFPSLLGIVVFVYGITQTPDDLYSAFDNTLTVPFSFFMAVWVATMLEVWKRQEVTLRTVWGCGELVDVETRRPEWFGVVLRRSPVTEKIEPHVPLLTRIVVRFITLGVLIFAIGCMVAFEVLVITVSSLNFDRLLGTALLGTALSAVLTLLNIVLITPLYLNLAHRLNQWENHRTFQQFEDSLITKTFTFIFINNFSSLLFVGIIKVLIPDSVTNIRHCSLTKRDNSCMNELMFSMAIIFVGLQFVTQAKLVLLPMLFQSWGRKHQEEMREKMIKMATASGKKDGVEKKEDVKDGVKRERGESAVTIVESITGLEAGDDVRDGRATPRSMTPRPGTPSKNSRGLLRRNSTRSKSRTKTSNFQTALDLKDLPQHLDDDLLQNWVGQDEYTSKIVQLGFVALFSAAFPLAPLFALVNNLLEVRFGAYRLLVQCQRPFPMRVKGVGAWFGVAGLLARIAILVNALVIAFSSQHFNRNYIGWVDEPYRLGAKLIFVIVFEHLVFMLVYIIDKLVPDVPGHILAVIDRQKYVNRLENEEEFEAEDELEFVENVAKGPMGFLSRR
ncbi:hypothetical protein HDU97_007180 [Phlyctochytrium planicorne]|nr:hypothetical protein HDU97_007180 [Phlyctochytrium planicorne]